MTETFSRLAQFMGPEAIGRLSRAKVAVIGLGAVGSYAVEGLARAAIGNLRLVDFDIVEQSNINRQLYALHSTVGQPKTSVAAARVADINPNCHVEAVNAFAHTDTFSTILDYNPDLIVDAIDSFTPKVELIAEAHRRRLPLISSMGAALRTDPTAIRIDRLSATRHCPLARRIRKRLRQRGVQADPVCVYSLEPVSYVAGENVVEIDGIVHAAHVRGRPRRLLGSLPTMTGIFGLAMANLAIRTIADDRKQPGSTTSS